MHGLFQHFWKKIAQVSYFRSKTRKVNISIVICIFELVCVLKFTLNKQFWICRPNMTEKGFSFPTQLKVDITIKFCGSSRIPTHNHFPSMELTLSWWGDFSTKKFQPEWVNWVSTELNWESQQKLSGQLIYLTIMSRPASTLIIQD